jgi:PAS domain S-box-containing protein
MRPSHEPINVNAGLFETALDLVPTPLICVNAAGVLLHVNAACCEALGWPRAALAGQPLSVVLAPTAASVGAEPADLANLSTDSVTARVWTLRRRDGSSFEASVSSKGHDGPDGSRVWVMTFSTRQAFTQADSTANYHAVLENSQHGIFIVQNGKVMYSNPKHEKMLGLRASDIVGQRSLDFVAPGDHERVLAQRERCLLGFEAPAYPTQFIGANGKLIPTEVYPVLITLDQAPATLVFVTDMSERLALESQLARNLEELDTILSASETGICLLRDRKYVWVNQRLCELFGYTESELIGQSVRIHYADDQDFESGGAESAKALRESGVWSGEARFRCRDGSFKWFFIKGRLADHGGEDATVWTLVDVTERRQLMQALADSELKFRQIVERASEAIVVCSAESKLLYVNPRGMELYELKHRDLARLNFPDLIHHEDRDQVAGELESCATSSVSVPIETMSVRSVLSAPKAEQWQELKGVVIEWEGKLAFLLFVNDITERRRMEQDTQRALVREVDLSVMKTRFISMASHEFKTPIAIIMSSAELLEHYLGTLSEEERVGAVRDIQSAAKRMRSMMEDMLTLGRADAGRLKLNLAQVDLPRFVEGLVAQIGRIDSSQHRFAVQWQPADPQEFVGLRLDETLLHNMLNNLLINAVKYSPDGALITLALVREETQLLLSVTDQGIGIPETELPRLFDAFFRASNSGQAHGTGLGLAIVKRAVDLHGGSVTVTSKLGAGSCFSIRLPLNAK